MIYALGDLNVDMVWDFDAPPPTADDHAPSTGRCSIRIGGVAFNFHAMAREAGEQVRVVGQVGNDRAGTWIRSELTEGAGHLVAVHPSLPTCCLAIQQYADGQSLCRHWTMSEPNANQSVPEAAVAAAQRATRPGDILFTTGYGLFRPMGGSAVAGAIRGFAASGARVVFDVLPHRLQHMGTSASLRKRLAEVGTRFALAIGEYDTWRYLLAGSSPDAAPDSAQLEDLGRRAEECAEFVAIRYGFENCGREAVFHDGELLWDRETGYASIDAHARIAFGERLTVQLVQQLILGRHSWPFRADVAFTLPLDILDRALASAPRESRILDYGCGYGRAYPKLLALGFRNISGVDTSASMVAEAVRRFPAIATRAIMHGAPLEPDSCEAVLLLGSLSSDLSDEAIRSTLRSIDGALCRGGVMVVADFLRARGGDRVARYDAYHDRFRAIPYGTFLTTHGGIARHLLPAEVDAAMPAGYAAVADWEIDVVSVNGIPARAFVAVRRKED